MIASHKNEMLLPELNQHSPSASETAFSPVRRSFESVYPQLHIIMIINVGPTDGDASGVSFRR